MTNTKEIISNEDYEMLSDIAEKYNMTVEDFGRLISKKNKSLRHHVRFSNDELNIVDERAKLVNVDRSKYCRLCYKKVLEEELYKDMKIIDSVPKKGETREHRVYVSFDNAKEYTKMRELAENFSVPFANLIRYFALNVEL